MRKDNKIHIGFSTEQKLKLKAKAEELGMSLSDYCRLILLKARVEISEVGK